MTVKQLLEEVRRRVPLGAAVGTRWKGSFVATTPLGALPIAAAPRIDAQGRRREQTWCDGWRVELAVLLRLTCPEAECPHALQVRAQWVDFHRPGRAASGPARLRTQPLVTDVDLTVGLQRFTARPARFPCFTPCPHDAHPPLTIEKRGFDLFEDGHCLGGGVTEAHGVRRPRLPTAHAAKVYVLARQMETQAVLGRLCGGGRGLRGVAGEGE